MLRRELPAPNRVVVPGDGIPCPRCGHPTQIRQHAEITAKVLAKPFRFRRWFWCLDPSCKTTMVTREEDRVWHRRVGQPTDRPTARSQ